MAVGVIGRDGPWLLLIDFRHILFYFCFLNAVWALTSGGFCIVSDTLVTTCSKLFSWVIATSKVTA